MYTIPGHHHVSMLTKHAPSNNHFYQNVLGLRRVKKNRQPRRSVDVSPVLRRFDRQCRNRVVIF